MAVKKDPRLARAGVSGFNKPKRTPNHPKISGVGGLAVLFYWIGQTQGKW